MQNNKISDMHFGSTSGYGYGDVGRDTIEKVFAEVFHTEDSLVRNHFISGTHAITVALFANLRPVKTYPNTNSLFDNIDFLNILCLAEVVYLLIQFVVDYDLVVLYDEIFIDRM